MSEYSCQFSLDNDSAILNKYFLISIGNYALQNSILYTVSTYQWKILKFVTFQVLSSVGFISWLYYTSSGNILSLLIVNMGLGLRTDHHGRARSEVSDSEGDEIPAAEMDKVMSSISSSKQLTVRSENMIFIHY